jgi:hypothetical protein
VVSVKPGPHFTPGKGSLVLIEYEAGRTSELFWIQRLKKKSFASAGD